MAFAGIPILGLFLLVSLSLGLQTITDPTFFDQPLGNGFNNLRQNRHRVIRDAISDALADSIDGNDDLGVMYTLRKEINPDKTYKYT